MNTIFGTIVSLILAYAISVHVWTLMSFKRRDEKLIAEIKGIIHESERIRIYAEDSYNLLHKRTARNHTKIDKSNRRIKILEKEVNNGKEF